LKPKLTPRLFQIPILPNNFRRHLHINHATAIIQLNVASSISDCHRPPTTIAPSQSPTQTTLPELILAIAFIIVAQSLANWSIAGIIYSLKSRK
jgi:hypothetical protein